MQLNHVRNRLTSKWYDSTILKKAAIKHYLSQQGKEQNCNEFVNYVITTNNALKKVFKQNDGTLYNILR